MSFNRKRGYDVTESFFGLSAENPNKGRFLILESVDKTKPITGFNPFLIQKHLEAISTKTEAWPLKDGSLKLLTESKKVTEKMLLTKKLGEIEIVVKDHPFLNFCEGIAYSPELINLTELEITTELSRFNVVGTRRIMKRNQDKLDPTPLIVLKFDMQRVPSSIVCGFIRLKIRQYYPNPMRCNKCQAFGHTKNKCNNNIICAKCSIEGEHTECTSVQCFNCKGPHASFDRKCPKFIEESAIIKIKVDERVAQPEAVRRYNQRKIAFSNHTYSNSVSPNLNQINPTSTSIDDLKQLFEIEAKKSAERQAILEAKLEAQVLESNKLRQIIETQSIQIKDQQKEISSLKNKHKVTSPIPELPKTKKTPKEKQQKAVKEPESENSDSSIASYQSGSSRKPKPFVFRKPSPVSGDTNTKHAPIIFSNSNSTPTNSIVTFSSTVTNDEPEKVISIAAETGMVVDDELNMRESSALSQTQL